MMAALSSEWENESQRVANLAQDTSYLIVERDNKRSTNGEVGAKIRSNLSQLERMVENLERLFRDYESNPAKYKLAQRDITSRRETLKKLQQEKNRLRNAERVPPTSSDRDALLGSSDGRSYGRETELTRDLTAQDMMKRTQTEMKTQDDVLDKMSKNLDNLKSMGHEIRDEADLHIKLLDELDSDVDKAQVNISRETRRVEHFTRDAKTCWLYATICILLAILLILVLVKWH